MRPRHWLVSVLLVGSVTSCGGGGSGNAGGTSSSSATAATAKIPLLVSDAPSNDWATVAVKVLAISLVPEAGGNPIAIYSAPSAHPSINLEQLDHVAQLLGTVPVAPGSYSGAVITLSANPSDVTLTSADNPDPGFAGAASSTLASTSLQIQSSHGTAGAQSVTVPVQFPHAFVVNSSGSTSGPLTVAVELSHPAFLLAHTPVTNDPTLWALNFQGPVSADAIDNATAVILRQLYGSFDSTAADGRSLSVTLELPLTPPSNPETAVSSGQQQTLLADSGNGTQFYDLDSGGSSTVSNFAALSGLTAGRQLRVEARFQADGSLVATRIWASNSFQTVWTSPEGHVTQVDANAGSLTIEDETGHSIQVQIDANTEFDFNGIPIGSGSSFLSSGPIERGFKVHVSPVDPTARKLTAQSVDIETAAFWGAISNATLTGFTYASDFARHSDNYTLALSYIAPSTPNGSDAAGHPINGYTYWNFAFPSEIASGSGVESAFQLATSGPVTAYGTSVATWNDPAVPNSWALRSTVLLPVPLGLATVNSGLVTAGMSSTFTLTPIGSSTPLTVELITASGSAPLVYQVQRDHGSVTMTAVDVTTASGLSQLGDALTAGADVNVFGLPKSSGAIQAYTLLYYTGIKPKQAPGANGNGGGGNGQGGGNGNGNGDGNG
jgi:hypothetical protein